MVGTPWEKKMTMFINMGMAKFILKESVIKIINKYNIVHFLNFVLLFNSLMSTMQPVISPAQCFKMEGINE